MGKYTTETFIKACRQAHGQKFDYSKTVYKTSKDKVIIICPIHGEFEMNPISHLKSRTGCRKCSYENPKKVLIDGRDRKSMREYSIWKGMKTRVTNPNTCASKDYYEKGITCCDEWMESFEQFYEDMGPCPEGYSLDRIDPEGNYCPENCRWASTYTQSQNRGDFNMVYTYNGETHVLKEWARILNIKYTTLYNRIKRSNMTFEEAIHRTEKDNLTEFRGEYKTIKEWCEIFGLKYSTVINRLDKHKWTVEEALTTPMGRRRQKIQDIVSDESMEFITQ